MTSSGRAVPHSFHRGPQTKQAALQRMEMPTLVRQKPIPANSSEVSISAGEVADVLAFDDAR